MKKAIISRGGQIQVPADVRRRWGTRSVLVDDRGDSLLQRPMPGDPIGAARGSLRPKTSARTVEDVRREERDAEAERESRVRS